MEEKRNYHEPCTCNQPGPRPTPCPVHKQSCKGSKGNCFCLPPKVVPVEVDGCPILFRKVEVPVSVGDETTDPPVAGKYRNVLLVYEATNTVYLYSSDGIPTRIDGLGNAKEIWDAIHNEEDERKDADDAIWEEIETIEASSDVVDVVGTYAELQAYDTAHLQDNDIIKVLQDETHDGTISYYRWNKTTQTFSYVGAEGPYYTASETDTLLAGKQDTLVAGNNIQIAADGKTISATDTTYTAGTNVQISAGNVISATDTTYSAFTGATSSAAGAEGLVPAPAAGDDTKYLSGDGTWKTINASSVTMFYNNYDGPTDGALYSDSAMTTAVKGEDVEAAFNQGKVIICYKSSSNGNKYVEVVNLGYFQWVPNYLDVGMAMASGTRFTVNFHYNDKTTTTCSRWITAFQEPLTAGSNISIIDGPNGTTISATDTTYSAFTGATSSVAGSAGLVPAPTTSDPDKFLKGDGTWGTISQYTPTVFYIDRSLPIYGFSPVSSVHVYKDSALTETATLQELYDAIDAGGATLVHLASGLIQTYNFLYAFHSPHNGNPDSGGDYMYFAGDDGTVLHVNDQSGQSTNNPAILSVRVYGLYSVDVMSGATSGHAGYRGLVPTPASADRDKFLKGDGTWSTLPAANNISSNDWTALWQ